MDPDHPRRSMLRAGVLIALAGVAVVTAMVLAILDVISVAAPIGVLIFIGLPLFVIAGIFLITYRRMPPDRPVDTSTGDLRLGSSAAEQSPPAVRTVAPRRSTGLFGMPPGVDMAVSALCAATLTALTVVGFVTDQPGRAVGQGAIAAVAVWPSWRGLKRWRTQQADPAGRR